MNSQEMYETLKDAGFTVSPSADHNTILVSLNRSIDKMEVWTALNHQVELAQIHKLNSNTVIVCE